MTKDNYQISKKRIAPFYILISIILMWFIGIQLFGPDERDAGAKPENIIYSGTFTWEKTDGSSEKISVPGHYDVSPEETMVITTTLPEDFRESTLAIRSSLQDISFYINGELRTKYDTSGHRIFGKNSSSRYVFCATSPEDAGKELRIEIKTHTGKYSGVVNAVYCGDKFEIWEYIFSCYGFETILAFFILFTGIFTIIFSLALGIVYQTKFDMEYLGWCMVLGSIWMLGESKFRQLLVPNSTLLGGLCFVVIMLCPLPVLFYVDTIQRGRHRKLYLYIEFISLLNFCVNTILHLTGIADYIETLPIDHGILAIALCAIWATFIYDIKNKITDKNYLVMIGLIIMIIAVAIEAVSSYTTVSLSGIILGIGMIILLFINILRTIQYIHQIEVQRQLEEYQTRQKQTEQISLQLMQTLSMTLDAKDEYTRGHSHRVAEYAALIASELGWKKEDIRHLKLATHLHDIGKIGIPDSILNKPTRLTPEEYNVIKEHTVIGAKILKNITLIDHLVEISRSHHERYDGNGYPDGLKGDAIPIQARIVAIADSYDAMCSRRIYRNALSDEAVYEEICKNKGTQFDPELADIFLRLLDEGRVVIDEHHEEDEDDFNLPHIEIDKFISDVMITIKAQEDSESYDFLTGLPMRNRGEKLVAQLMQEHDGCLIFLDMDNLKKINDIYGHKAGDRALRLLGHLLSEEIRPAGSGDSDSIICRLGGDEFLLFVPDVSKEMISEIMKQLLQKFQTIKSEDPKLQYASISAGLCLTEKGDSFEECYTKADKALYYVKQNGKGNFFFYHQMEQNTLSNSVTDKDLALVAGALRTSGNYSGALNLNYREFAKIYEYMNNLGERYKRQCYLVMVTLDTAPDYVIYMENIEHALDCMEQAILRQIRQVDICTRYSSMQYLIILFEPDKDRIPQIMERIFLQYYKLYNKSNSVNFIPKYDYIPMTKSNGMKEDKTDED